MKMTVTIRRDSLSESACRMFSGSLQLVFADTTARAKPYRCRRNMHTHSIHTRGLRWRSEGRAAEASCSSAARPARLLGDARLVLLLLRGQQLVQLALIELRLVLLLLQLRTLVLLLGEDVELHGKLAQQPDVDRLAVEEQHQRVRVGRARLGTGTAC